MTTHQCAEYEWTLPAEEDPNSQRVDVIATLKDWASKWWFQYEEGDQGYKHFQGKLNLKKKRRLQEIAPLLQAEPPLKKIHLSPTCKNNIGKTNYIIKKDTRIDGPWTWEDEEIYIPRQIREITELYPWQQSIVDQVGVWDTRTINVIYDKDGNIGKSTLVGYLRAHQLAKKLPFCNDFKDIMRMVCDMPTSRCYLIDMPRAINKEKLFQMYSAIEEIKNGYAYDDRYKFKEKFFDCPNIWVFSNTLPDRNLVSNDRWKIWEVKDNQLAGLQAAA